MEVGFSMAQVLVTGGAGFIGSHVSEALLERGDRVTVLDNLDRYYDPAIKRRNLEQIRSRGNVRFVEGDIRDEAAVREAMGSGTDGVIHLAARAGVRPSIESPGEYVSVNLDGTTTLLRAATELKVPKFVFASSSSVYGNSQIVPFQESDPVMTPVSPYAATKRSGELICHSWHHCYGLPITCLRFFTVYGPRQRPDMAIHKFVARILKRESIPFFGDGNSRRDYTYISDIVDGVLKAYDQVKAFRIFNLGESQTTSLSELITIIEEATGCKAQLDRQPFQLGDVQETYADVNRAKKELGYAPSTTVRDGVHQFVSWYRDQIR